MGERIKKTLEQKQLDRVARIARRRETLFPFLLWSPRDEWGEFVKFCAGIGRTATDVMNEARREWMANHKDIY